MLDACSLHEHRVFTSLTASVKAGLELPFASRNHLQVKKNVFMPKLSKFDKETSTIAGLSSFLDNYKMNN